MGSFWAKIKHLKSHSIALGFGLQTDMKKDLSYEVLNIDFGQGAAKISEVKNNFCQSVQFKPMCPGPAV